MAKKRTRSANGADASKKAKASGPQLIPADHIDKTFGGNSLGRWSPIAIAATRLVFEELDR